MLYRLTTNNISQETFSSIWISRNVFGCVQKHSWQICVMVDALSCRRAKNILNAVSWGWAVSVDLLNHLQYQFYDFNMVVLGMMAVTEFMTVQAHNGKEEVETNQLQ